jgi:uncharacterized protein YtpQ (UPF0354 family)
MSLLSFFGCKNSIDVNNIYPYLITNNYPGTDDSTGITYPIGNEIFATLVLDLNGLVQNVQPKDLKRASMTVKDAHRTALENLQKRFKSGDIKAQRFDGPQNKPFILVGGSWLAATAILLPDISERAKKNLNSDSICFSIPHRDAMLIFPKGDSSYLEEMKRMINEKESDGSKPLTFKLFKKNEERIEPLE